MYPFCRESTKINKADIHNRNDMKLWYFSKDMRSVCSRTMTGILTRKSLPTMQYTVMMRMYQVSRGVIGIQFYFSQQRLIAETYWYILKIRNITSRDIQKWPRLNTRTQPTNMYIVVRVRSKKFLVSFVYAGEPEGVGFPSKGLSYTSENSLEVEDSSLRSFLGDLFVLIFIIRQWNQLLICATKSKYNATNNGGNLPIFVKRYQYFMKSLVKLFLGRRVPALPIFSFSRGKHSSEPKQWQKLMKQPFYGPEIDIPRTLNSQSKSRSIYNYILDSKNQIHMMDLVRMCAQIEVTVHKREFLALNKLLTKRVLEHIQQKQQDVLVTIYNFLYMTAQRVKADVGLIEALVMASMYCYPKLTKLQKEMAVYVCLKGNIANKEMLETYFRECKHEKELKYQAMSFPRETTYYLYLKITNMALLEDYLPHEEFIKYFEMEQFELMMMKYLDIIQNHNNLMQLKLMLIQQSRPYMVYKLPFSRNFLLTRTIKQRLANFWQSLHPSVNFFHDLRVNISLCLLFHPTDRYLLRNCFLKMQQIMFYEQRMLVLAKLSTYKYQHKCLMYVWLNAMKTRIVNNENPERIMGDFLMLYNLAVEEIIEEEMSDIVKINYMMVKREVCEVITRRIGKFNEECYAYVSDGEGDCKDRTKITNTYISDDLEEPPELEEMSEGDDIVPSPQLAKQFKQIVQQTSKVIGQSKSQLIQEMLKKYKVNKILPYITKKGFVDRVFYLSEFLQQVAMLCKMKIPKLEQVETFKKYLNSSEGVKAIKQLICLPGVLDSLCIIQRYIQKQHSTSIFSAPLQQFVSSCARLFQETLLNLPLSCSSLLSTNPGFKPDILYRPSMNCLIKFNTPIFTQICTNKSGVPMFKEGKDLFSERFSMTEENVLSNLHYSDLARYCVQQSELKEMAERVIQGLTQRVKDVKAVKNVVKYPYFADYLMERGENKVAVWCEDYTKLYFGVDCSSRNRFHQGITESMKYFRQNGWKILILRQQDIAYIKSNVKQIRILQFIQQALCLKPSQILQRDSQ